MQSVKPFLSRFDLDPGNWRPRFYGLELEFDYYLNAEGSGIVEILNQPFIWIGLSHRIIGCVNQPGEWYQNGQYSIEWKDEQSSYSNGPIHAELAFGMAGTVPDLNPNSYREDPQGAFHEFPWPIAYAGNRSIFFKVVNRCEYGWVPFETARVGIGLHGLANFGEDIDPEQTPCIRPRKAA